MRSKIGPIIVSLTVVGLYLNGCRSSRSQRESEEFQLTEGQQQTSDDEDSFSSDDTQAPKSSLVHPKEANAWFTRRLLMTVAQPSATKINECKENTEGATKDATNLRGLNEVAESLQATVEKRLNIYHWCFYQMMADLDQKLENDSSLMQDKANLFFGRMPALWAIAQSLDQATESPVYMNYLRTRYTDISQNMFGRRLEIVDLNSFIQKDPGRGKPQGRFSE
jgi:hypothetical protein